MYYSSHALSFSPTLVFLVLVSSPNSTLYQVRLDLVVKEILNITGKKCIIYVVTGLGIYVTFVTQVGDPDPGWVTQS